MFKFAAVLILAAGMIGPSVQQSSAPPVQVSGVVASKLEKQRVPINAMLLPPPTARKGAVLLEFTVRPDGTVTDIQDLHADTNVVTKYLANASIDSLSRWTYRPYLVDGQPAAMRVVIQFRFDYPGGLNITYP